MFNVKESLEFLIALQVVDKKLFYLEFSKGDLPITVAGLKKSIKKIENKIESTKTAVEEIEKERISTENLVELSQEKLKKYQTKLYDVTSNKEYDAITKEIETKSKEIEDGETSILEHLQTKENNQNLFEEFDQELTRLKSELKIKEKELGALIKATEKEVLKLNHQREKLVVRLKKPTLSRYERIKNAKSGVAVVPIKRDACGGCFKAIPPQKIVEVSNLEQLIQCDVCGRILVPEEKLDPIPL